MFLFNQLLIHAPTRKLDREPEVMYTFLHPSFVSFCICVFGLGLFILTIAKAKTGREGEKRKVWNNEKSIERDEKLAR